MSRFASFKCHFKMKWLVLFFTTLVADALKIENVIFEGCRTFQPQIFLAPWFNPRLFIPIFFNCVDLMGKRLHAFKCLQ